MTLLKRLKRRKLDGADAQDGDLPAVGARALHVPGPL